MAGPVAAYACQSRAPMTTDYDFGRKRDIRQYAASGARRTYNDRAASCASSSLRFQSLADIGCVMYESLGSPPPRITYASTPGICSFLPCAEASRLWHGLEFVVSRLERGTTVEGNHFLANRLRHLVANCLSALDNVGRPRGNNDAASLLLASYSHGHRALIVVFSAAHFAVLLVDFYHQVVIGIRDRCDFWRELLDHLERHLSYPASLCHLVAPPLKWAERILA